MYSPPTIDCQYCIEGWQPIRDFAILGPCFRRCLYCQLAGALSACPDCGSNSYFPAGFGCQHCFIEHLAEQGVTAVFCPTCDGVTNVVPIDTVPPEVDDDLPF
jgi:hypothetical protein